MKSTTFADLRSAARSVGERQVVVVTERYPPDSFGGAEVSLHISLQSMIHKDGLLVVTFGDHLLPHSYEIDGIAVLSLPRGRAAVLSKPSMIQRLLRRGRIATQSSDGQSEDRLLVARVAKLGPPRGGVVSDFVHLRSGGVVDALRLVLRAVKPALIHADNYRAIVLLASTGVADCARIGVVRDNRFHCFRYDQSLLVNGVPCVECRLQCAAADLPRAPLFQLETLRRSRDFRWHALASMDKIVVTSRYLDEQIGAIVGATKVARIPNAADDYDRVVTAMRGVAELPGTNLLVVGMLNENKGQLQLACDLRATVDRIPDAVIHFAGRGERIGKRLQELAADQALPERLILHGYVSRAQLYALYRACQVVVLPTLWPEPFGRVPLEAGLARRPVVAYAVGGLKESIIHKSTGYLVAPGDAKSLMRRIQELAENPLLRRRMGEAAFRRVQKHYSVKSQSKLLGELWDRMLMRTEAGREGHVHHAIV